MARGKVKWYSAERGYGMIEREDSRLLLVHYSELQGDGFRMLEEGAEVEFELETGHNGRELAANVRVVKDKG